MDKLLAVMFSEIFVIYLEAKDFLAYLATITYKLL